MEVISIIGAKGGLGKTFLAVNLGNFLSVCGLKVLLIDCDFNTNGATNFMELNGLAINDELPPLSLESILINNFESGEKENEKVEAVIKDGFCFIPTSLKSGYSNYKNFKLDELNHRRESLGELFEEWSGKYDVVILDHAGGYTDLANFLLFFTSTIMLVNMDNISGIKSARDLYKKMSMFNQEIVQCVNVLDTVPYKESESILRKCYGFMEDKQYKVALAKGQFLKLNKSNIIVLERIAKELLPMHSKSIMKASKSIINQDIRKQNELENRIKSRKWIKNTLVVYIVGDLFIFLLGLLLMKFRIVIFNLSVITAILWLVISTIITPLLGSVVLLGLSFFHYDGTTIRSVVAVCMKKYIDMLLFWTYKSIE